MLEILPEDGHASFAVKSPPPVAAWAEAAPALAARITTPMVKPMRSTAGPRLRPGVFLFASKSCPADHWRSQRRIAAAVTVPWKT